MVAVPVELAARNPSEPVPQLAALADRTATQARKERAKLVKLPSFEAWWLDADDLGATLLSANKEWSIAYGKSRTGAAPAKAAEGEKMKGKLMRTARYVLRRYPDVQEELDQIARGTGVADLAADLEILADLVGRYPSFFADALDDGFAGRASILGAELRTGVEPGDSAGLQDRRNRLFWATREATMELRDALAFLWDEQPHKLAELGVTYVARLRKQQREAKKKKEPA